jgi:hypothetical protein
VPVDQLALAVRADGPGAHVDAGVGRVAGAVGVTVEPDRGHRVPAGGGDRRAGRLGGGVEAGGEQGVAQLELGRLVDAGQAEQPQRAVDHREPQPGALGHLGEQVEVRLAVLHQHRPGRPVLVGLDADPGIAGQLRRQRGHADVGAGHHLLVLAQLVEAVVGAHPQLGVAVGLVHPLLAGDVAGEQRAGVLADRHLQRAADAEHAGQVVGVGPVEDEGDLALGRLRQPAGHADRRQRGQRDAVEDRAVDGDLDRRGKSGRLHQNSSGPGGRVGGGGGGGGALPGT